MPRIKLDKEPEVVQPEAVKQEAEVQPEPKKEKVVKNVWPEVGYTGKFHAVEHEGGYVVYNPGGQRATGVLRKEIADDIVREQNRAAQIKVR
jgi:hypothetical protein